MTQTSKKRMSKWAKQKKWQIFSLFFGVPFFYTYIFCYWKTATLFGHQYEHAVWPVPDKRENNNIAMGTALLCFIFYVAMGILCACVMKEVVSTGPRCPVRPRPRKWSRMPFVIERSGLFIVCSHSMSVYCTEFLTPRKVFHPESVIGVLLHYKSN